MKLWLTEIDTDWEENRPGQTRISLVIRDGEKKPSVMKRWKRDTGLC